MCRMTEYEGKMYVKARKKSIEGGMTEIIKALYENKNTVANQNEE